MNNLGEEDIKFLEEAKSQGFRAGKGHINSGSGYFQCSVEVPGGHLFTEDEIDMRYCQGCLDDIDELDIDEFDCTCSKEKYREKVKRILSLIEDNADETLKIIDC